MSELTERSKCVFQAKLAEQAERYDGRFRKPKRVLVFTGDDWIRDPTCFWGGILRLFVVPIRCIAVASQSEALYCRVRTIALTGAFMHHPPSFTLFFCATLPEMIVALKKLCGIADIELTVRKTLRFGVRKCNERNRAAALTWHIFKLFLSFFLSCSLSLSLFRSLCVEKNQRVRVLTIC